MRINTQKHSFSPHCPHSLAYLIVFDLSWILAKLLPYLHLEETTHRDASKTITREFEQHKWACLLGKTITSCSNVDPSPGLVHSILFRLVKNPWIDVPLALASQMLLAVTPPSDI